MTKEIEILETVFEEKVNQIKKEFESYEASSYRLGFLAGLETVLEAIKEAKKQTR